MLKFKESLERMEQQGSKYNFRKKHLPKVILSHSESFQKFSVSFQDLLNVRLEDKQKHFFLCVYIDCVYR